MLRALIVSISAIGLVACSSFPEQGRGGMAEFQPLLLAFWDSQQQPVEVTDGLRFEITLLKHQLDLLVLEGAKICFPASVVQAKLTEQRMMREYNGGLVLDAANQVEIQQHALRMLEKRLDTLLLSGACQLKQENSGEKSESLDHLLIDLNSNNQFALDSPKLTPAYRDQLERLVPRLHALSHRVEITGHADAQGNQVYNLQLAHARAQVVADFLIGQGIHAERIHLITVGEQQPYARGSSQEVYHSNRRVTLNLVAIQQ